MQNFAVDVPDSGPWHGQWLWQAEDGPADTWMCFRRTVTIANPAQVPALRIAADSKYWLWVNGELVVREGALKRGPNRSDTWLDVVDVRAQLRVGANTIAVLVWYWGKHGFAHWSSGRGGLLIDGGAAFSSDGKWRACVHPAFAHAADPQPNFRLAEHHVRFDARADLSGWTEPAFDDHAWPLATVKGAPGTAPWGQLWPRPLPQWRDYGETLITALPMPKMNAAAGETGEVHVSSGEPITLPLPYNAQVTPIIEVTANGGELVTLFMDHYCGGGAGKDFNVRAEYVCRPGRQRFEAPGWMNGHALTAVMPAGLQVHALGWRESGYDTDFSGDFTCNDDFYQVLWQKARRTLYVTMRDTYMDCPDRERAQWWGDVVVELGETAYALCPKAHALTRKAILDLVRWQRDDGVLFSPTPGCWEHELPPQMLAAVSPYGFMTYFRNTGDVALMREVYPAVRRYLALWQVDETGLAVHRAGGWDWGDWGEQVDQVLIDNGWLILAYAAAIEHAELAGEIADAADWRARHVALIAACRAQLCSAEGFRAAARSGVSDDRGNALMVLAGVALPEHTSAVLTVFAQVQLSSPYMEKYVLEALFRLGRPELALARMRARYAPMVASPLTTLWELWASVSWSSVNHAWAGGPLTLLSECVVGLAPATPGWRTFTLTPAMGELSQVSATVASVSGTISAEITRDATGHQVVVTVPVDCAGLVSLPGARATLDGVAVAGERRAGRILIAVGPGTHRVTAAAA